jgi:hypothetical protein
MTSTTDYAALCKRLRNDCDLTIVPQDDPFMADIRACCDAIKTLIAEVEKHKQNASNLYAAMVELRAERDAALARVKQLEAAQPSVPREPTMAMYAAARRKYWHQKDCRDTWIAMYDAALAQPAPSACMDHAMERCSCYTKLGPGVLAASPPTTAQPSVPREPTDAMIEASARGYLWINPAHHRGIWIAMYDAARAKE